MATATASTRASTKTAPKTTSRTVRKTAAKKAGAAPEKVPAKKATAKKTVAKRDMAKKSAAATTTATAPAKKTAARTSTARKSSAKKAPARRRTGPVMLDGKPAHNRHFLLTRSIYEDASDRCDSQGLSLSDVLRHGIDNYGAKAPTAEKAKAGRSLPKSALAELKRLYRSDSARLTEYLAACHRSGWTLQALADGLVQSGAVDKISRQAVSLRILKAPERLSKDLPAVPALGPRRAITSPRKGLTMAEFEKAGASAKREREANTYDLSFRVTDEAYELASRRAKYEGAMMSGVMDQILLNYLDGKYDKALGKIARPKSA